ncbi:hypothetical protein ACFSL4_32720 [Streptomyces caeni]|uniref:NADH:flavin oxidoreductase/NADH oxidase N-terminal domain-containing protein n=1 Tax=Streptomyces caeni TaxID=2307231 RepID=A0ABW4J0Q3_9ACTN
MTTPALFEPARLGPLTLRNRFIEAATFEGMTKGAQAGDELIEFHRLHAAGGVAMTTVAYCAVAPEGRTERHQLQQVHADHLQRHPLRPGCGQGRLALNAEEGRPALRPAEGTAAHADRLPGRGPTGCRIRDEQHRTGRGHPAAGPRGAFRHPLAAVYPLRG